jgi:hypothetical protein
MSRASNIEGLAKSAIERMPDAAAYIAKVPRLRRSEAVAQGYEQLTNTYPQFQHVMLYDALRQIHPRPVVLVQLSGGLSIWSKPLPKRQP